MLLDPRHWRLDDLLRRPLRADDTLGEAQGLHGPAGKGWGFTAPLRFPGAEPVVPYTLDLIADGEPVTPGEGLYRPSHLTRHGGSVEGLQVAEDAFVGDDAAVSTLWLRNPTADSVFVDIRVGWGLRGGEHDFGAVCRLAPPGDDLRVRIPAGGRGFLTFVLAVAEDAQTARSRADAWYQNPHPARHQAERLQAWFDNRAARFDCDDPYLTRLWYHGWHRRWRGDAGEPPPNTRDRVQDDFEAGDFDRPRERGRAWERFVLERLLGLREEGSRVVLDPMPDADGLRHYCVDDLPVAGGRWSVVWDDPAAPGDLYDDGDKGFTVYRDRRRVFHADAPSAVALEAGDEL